MLNQGRADGLVGEDEILESALREVGRARLDVLDERPARGLIGRQGGRRRHQRPLRLNSPVWPDAVVLAREVTR